MQNRWKPQIVVVAVGAAFGLALGPVLVRPHRTNAQSSGAKTGANGVDAKTTAALPAEMKPYTETIPGTPVRFEMAPIPGGTFTMGSPATETGRSNDEGPQHQVQIDPFWMEVYETTWDEYDVFAFSSDLLKQRASTAEKSDNDKLADAVTRPTPPYSDETFGFGRDHHPAIDMTHHAAMEYTRWLSAKTGKEYRLPTEAEWEYACRAGSNGPYFFGSDAKQLGDYAWHMDNSENKPHEIGKKKANPWGLYDILGNVAEWVLDEYDKDFYKNAKPDELLTEPVLLPSARKYPDVARGGSWDDDPKRVRCAARQASSPDWSQQDPQRPRSIWWHTDATFVGFRVVRPLQDNEKLKDVKSLVKKYD
ncbi:MAG TPA: formylglycine-generating enzyme family protein [Terriglobia bacterium]|nr:formylglycine-generating enzyme family protein [Terriglobia bacterium]